MKSFNKLIIINFAIALVISLTIGFIINKNYTNRVNQRLETTKEIVNLKINTFINESNSISESLTTILSNSRNENLLINF